MQSNSSGKKGTWFEEFSDVVIGRLEELGSVTSRRLIEELLGLKIAFCGDLIFVECCEF